MAVTGGSVKRSLAMAYARTGSVSCSDGLTIAKAFGLDAATRARIPLRKPGRLRRDRTRTLPFLRPHVSALSSRNRSTAEIVQALPVLVGIDEPPAVFLRYGTGAARRHLFIDHESVGELGADVLRAFGAVVEPPFHNTGPDGTGFINEARGRGQASVADDLVRGDPKAEVLVPTIAEDLLAGWVCLDVRAVRKA